MKMYSLQSDIIKKTAGILQVFTVRYEKTHASCMFEVESSANSISLGSTSTHSSSSSSSSSSSTGDGALRGSRSSNNSSLKTHLQYQKLNLENYRKKSTIVASTLHQKLPQAQPIKFTYIIIGLDISFFLVICVCFSLANSECKFIN